MVDWFEAGSGALPALARGILQGKEILGKDEDREIKRKQLGIKERELQLLELQRLEELRAKQEERQLRQRLGEMFAIPPQTIEPVPSGAPGYGIGEEAAAGLSAEIPGRPSPLQLAIQGGLIGKEQMGEAFGLGGGALHFGTEGGFVVGRHPKTGQEVLRQPIQFAPEPPWVQQPPPGSTVKRTYTPQGGTGFTLEEPTPQKPPQPQNVYAAGRELGFPEEMRQWTQGQWGQANARAAEIEGLKTKERALGGLSDEVIAQRAKQAGEIEKVRQSFVQSKAYLTSLGRLKAQMVEVEPGVTVAQRIEELKNAGRPLQAGIAQDVVRYENYIRAAEALRKEFTDAEILKYVGLGKYQANQLKQFIETDPRFLRFMVLNEQMRGTAFGEGGKQLTPFEAAITFGYTPSGREAWGEYYIAKMDEILPRYRTLLQETLTVGTTPRGQFKPQYGPGPRTPGAPPTLPGPAGPPAGRPRILEIRPKGP